MARIDEIRASGRPLVGYYGHPPRAVLESWTARTGGDLVDLDVDYGAPSTGLLPEAFCKVVDTVVANALALTGQLEVVVASVGPDKCESGRFAAWLLRRHGVRRVVETENRAPATGEPLVLCEAGGPVRERVDRIMETIVRPLEPDERARWTERRCRPTHGLWGTPPSVPEVLDLMPETSHLFGWTRCVEAGAPADLDLECHVEPGLPTVFFVQGFCDKALLARQLAADHRGLLVDVHDRLTGSAAAKIEAFVRLTAP